MDIRKIIREQIKENLDWVSEVSTSHAVNDALDTYFGIYTNDMGDTIQYISSDYSAHEVTIWEDIDKSSSLDLYNILMDTDTKWYNLLTKKGYWELKGELQEWKKSRYRMIMSREEVQDHLHEN
jgi:hypothetical protein